MRSGAFAGTGPEHLIKQLGFLFKGNLMPNSARIEEARHGLKMRMNVSWLEQGLWDLRFGNVSIWRGNYIRAVARVIPLTTHCTRMQPVWLLQWHAGQILEVDRNTGIQKPVSVDCGFIWLCLRHSVRQTQWGNCCT